MATAFYDIEGQTVDTEVDTIGWTRSGTGIPGIIKSVEHPYGAKVIQLTRSSDSDIQRTFSWSSSGNPADAENSEILMLFRTNTAATANSLGPMTRQSGGNGYRLSFDVNDTDPTKRLRLDSEGGTGLIARNTNHGITVTTDTWLFMRVQANGTTIRGKVWAQTVDEPDWSVSGTNASFTTGGYAFHVRSNNTATIHEIAWFSVGTGTDAAPLPSTTEEYPGITITGIKEPNIANEEVTGVSNARVKVWHGASPVDTGAEDELHTNQTITNGSLTTELNGGTLDDNVIVEVMWTVGTERKLFIAETTVVDIGSGA